MEKLKVMSKKDLTMQRIINSIKYKRTENVVNTTIEEDPLYDQIVSILKAGSSRKAFYMSAFRISKLTEIAGYNS
jgi:hypothetical protein